MFLLVFVLFIISTHCKDYFNDYDPIEEIQHAVCKIATEEIQASANATITRQLKGICTSKELNLKLEKLEKRFVEELQAVKRLLIAKGVISANASPLIKAKNMGRNNEIFQGSRRSAEISKFNLTTHDGDFYYFWNIEADRILEDKEIISNTFYSSGRLYFLQFVPFHQGTKYVSIELKSVGSVRKMHRFIIIDQEDSKYDISSQTLGRHNFANFYRISRAKIAKFIKNNELIIKLILHIN